MKPIVLTIALLLSGLLQAQTAKPINAKLQKATVYLRGAHLYYTETVNLATGNNDIVFENISPFLTEESLQAYSKGGVVMDVRYEVRYKEKVKVTKQYDKEIALALDSLDDLTYEEKNVDNKLKALATEKTMLLNNRMIKGDPLKDSLALLKQGMEFLREKLNDIYEQELKWEKQKNKLAKKRVKLNERYNALILLQNGEGEDEDDAQPIHQVIVTVFTETATSSQISFNYFIENASWVPMYDLQATSAANNLHMKYFADVTQGSGLDWKNTALTLSTSTPTESNIKPELAPWFLSFIEYRQRKDFDNGISNNTFNLQRETLTLDKKATNAGMAVEAETILDYITMTENLIRTEYEIKLNYTINSDGKSHKVMISQRDVPMTLEFAAVPKISTNAFLLAKITGWEDMNIIPGNARLYFDGGYVGQMFLDASGTEDTLAVNMGRDKTIAITRKKIKEKMKEKFIHDERVETRSIEIVVRNTKNIPIEIELEDQIPVAMGTDLIKVELKEGDGAELDEVSGSLKWKLKLKPGDKKKIVFTYEIRYPKDKPIAGL